jgi:hypothetical protein
MRTAVDVPSFTGDEAGYLERQPRLDRFFDLARPSAKIAALAQSGGTPSFCSCLQFIAAIPRRNSCLPLDMPRNGTLAGGPVRTSSSPRCRIEVGQFTGFCYVALSEWPIIMKATCSCSRGAN